ncbi:MAG: hypothetical protein U9R48_10570 [Chloroflexota bacterium]|nr:hypothetical protein [Chloroflexota bacterium]
MFSDNDKETILQALWRDKMHVAPRAFELSPPSVQEHFEYALQATDIVLDTLRPFPTGLLRLWRDAPRSHVVVTHRSSGYRPGPQPWRDGQLESVCYVSLGDLCEEKKRAMVAVFHLLDHVWGSWGAVGKPWLSDGGGVTELLRRVGQRFVKIQSLGYGHEELGVCDPHDYFAHGLWMYFQARQRLNVLDPLLEKLYRGTLLRGNLW